MVHPQCPPSLPPILWWLSTPPKRPCCKIGNETAIPVSPRPSRDDRQPLLACHAAHPKVSHTPLRPRVTADNKTSPPQTPLPPILRWPPTHLLNEVSLVQWLAAVLLPLPSSDAAKYFCGRCADPLYSGSASSKEISSVQLPSDPAKILVSNRKFSFTVSATTVYCLIEINMFFYWVWLNTDFIN